MINSIYTILQNDIIIDAASGIGLVTESELEHIMKSRLQVARDNVEDERDVPRAMLVDVLRIFGSGHHLAMDLIARMMERPGFLKTVQTWVSAQAPMTKK